MKSIVVCVLAVIRVVTIDGQTSGSLASPELAALHTVDIFSVQHSSA